jgi:hypothetical protein
MSLRGSTPWQVRMLAKIVLSAAAGTQSLARRSGLIRDGAMDRPEYAIEAFRKHFRRYQERGGRVPFTVLELGPGESAATALVAAAHGAARTYMVDSADHIRRDPELYQRILAFLRDEGLPAGDLEARFEARSSLDQLLDFTHATYLTGGLADLSKVPTGSVDLTFSNAVLEHVRLWELPSTLEELSRVMAPGGLGSHEVDLRDHLDESLNHLRFSDRFWESALVARSGFYTNRVRFSALLEHCRRAGFTTACPEVWCWPSLPVDRRRLAARFRELPDEDLRVKACQLVLTK